MDNAHQVHCQIFPNEYRDSMVLMSLSHQLGKVPGIQDAIALMGTGANVDFIRKNGLITDQIRMPAPNDLVIAYRATDVTSQQAAQQVIRALLFNEDHNPGNGTGRVYHTIQSAVMDHPSINLACISLPGEYAERETEHALRSGLNVFLFSDNVPVEAEVRLKKLADEKGLLLMGPECGTSFIHGVALGLSSAAHPGPVGVIGASGSGTQEIYTLLDRAGVGISHAIGTGGRDLSAAVGGMTTRRALTMLEADSRTRVIALVSKKPETQVARQILERLASCPKPTVICFLGEQLPRGEGNLRVTASLEEAVEAVGDILGQKILRRDDRAALSTCGSISLRPEQKYIRGLFTGGTFCQEATLIWEKTLGEIWSLHPLNPDSRLPDPRSSRGHTALDLGDEAFTIGRPHPCIDAQPRLERMQQELEDREVAVIVVDLELGYGSHPDMAGALAPLISAARQKNVYVVAHACGTELDPQNVVHQEAKLAAAGAIIAETNAAAARIALQILENAK